MRHTKVLLLLLHLKQAIVHHYTDFVHSALAQNGREHQIPGHVRILWCRMLTEEHLHVDRWPPTRLAL